MALAVGDIASSNWFPSLATVVDRLRPREGRNLDCRKVDFDSDLGVGSPSLLRLVLLLWLLMRKKFFSFWGRWVLAESFGCFFEEKGRLEKLRFSVAILIWDLSFGETLALEARLGRSHIYQ